MSAARSRSRCYTAIGFATHRRNDGWSPLLDYLVLVPRAVPGLLAGLAFLWVFLFVPAAEAAAHHDLQHVARLHGGLARLWHAAHLERRCCRSAPELEEAARTVGADAARASRRDVTLPLIRHGLLARWLLCS